MFHTQNQDLTNSLRTIIW